MAHPYLSLLRTAWKYARHKRKKYILVYAMFILANTIAAIHPVLLGWFVGKLQHDIEHALYYLLLYLSGYFCLRLFDWSLHGPARIMERNLAFYLSRNFLQEKYHQVLHLPAKWHQDHHSGATINRIRKAYEALREFFDKGFMYLYSINKFVFSVAAMLYFSPLFGSIAIMLGVLNIWVIRKFDKPFIKTIDDVNEREHVVSSTLFDTLSNIMTVITLRLEKNMESGLLHKVQQILVPFRKNALVNEWKWFAADMILALIYCVVVTGFIYQNWHPGQPFYIAGLITLLGFVNQFTSVFQNVTWQYTELVQFDTYVQTAGNISRAYAQQHRPEEPVKLPANWRDIEVRQLSFSHHETYNEAVAPRSLHQLNLRIRRQQKIALIGESGSGKSTLLSLLRGLYIAEPGVGITVDGKRYEMGSLNDSATLFPQEPEIFENTIAYNITLGLPFPEEEIFNVCEIANFTDVVMQLPEKLASDIREKGVNLSGGQKQRLALARGILAARKSEMILLDEPTSSVDAKTEAKIYEKLFTTFTDKAIISSMHRLHLLTKFDYIYLLHKGRIVDEGSFEHLQNSSPSFQELWRHQEKSQTDKPFI